MSNIFKKNIGEGRKGSIDSFEKKMLIKKIEKIDDLPVPSKHVTKIIKLLKDPDQDVTKIVHEIEQDQTLVSQILKLINSSYYALKNNIDSVSAAVNLLGFMNIKEIVYSASVMDIFGEDQKQDFEHAYTSSVLIKQLIEENDLPVSKSLSLAMLMHDIGKVILYKLSPKKVAQVATIAHEKELPIFEVENLIFKINHTEVADIVLQKWDMPPEIIAAIIYHHSTEEFPEEYMLEIALVQLVNWIDLKARNCQCPYVPEKLLKATGFEAIDKGYWVRYQRDLINNLKE